MATVETPTLGTALARRSELVLAAALLGLLVVMLIPLPPILLDVLLTLNIALTLLLVLVTLSVKQPLDFSVFPSLLLLLTLYRLSLSVAVTRQILLRADGGMLVSAFGNFVVGGNLVVGLVVFAILFIIQFVVITKGASRISEVAARFVLDAMPGKQMAIDAELNAGAIDDGEARRRRQALLRESEFYGTMDGASKFVRGDAIAAVIITAINLVGGIIIGVIRGMPIMTAVRTYCVLTIGDGLISQIPALMVSTTAGILVTKSTSQIGLGQEITGQFMGSPRSLGVAAVILGLLGLAPGMPMLPFMALAVGLGLAARKLAGAPAASATPAPGAPAAGAARSGPGPGAPATEGYLEDFLQADRIGLEIGSQLLPLVDSRRGPGLIDRIGGLRRDLARQSGLWVPPVRVRDNIQLEQGGYRVLVLGREVARGTLRTDNWLVFDPGGGTVPLAGEAVREPAFGLPAKWVPDTERARAELAGYTVVDAVSVLITHLGEIVRRHAHELLSREDLKALIDRARQAAPAVVDELIPNMMTVGSLHRVLTLLLEERVPISNFVRILESLANHAAATKDLNELAERVRTDIGRVICDPFRDEQGRVRAIVLDPRLEIELRRSVQEKTLVLDPVRLEALIVRLSNEQRKANARGQEVALLCDTSLRRVLRQALARTLPTLPVVAYQEIPLDLLMEPVALIRPEDLLRRDEG